MTEKKVKQPPKTRPFNNLNVIDLTVGGIEGTITIPFILEDEDLAIYIEYMAQDAADEEDLEAMQEAAKAEDAPDGAVIIQSEPNLIRQIRVRHESRRHMVKAIDFPGVTIDNFHPDGKQPYPALVFAIGDILDEVVRDALHLPNS